MTLEQMNDAIKELRGLRTKIDAANDVLKGLRVEEEMLEGLLIESLQENNLKNYRGPDGLISVSHKTSVRTPKTTEDKEAFFAYLRDKGVYDMMISVNSATLNSFYKQEFENAVLNGNENFTIPGLNEVTLTPSLSFRKA
ncbi:MAG: hypothetical protein IPL34_20340 [Thiofilum sp.]|uniref:gp33 family protein n=1 Tax=Thiofilum sp. TaxID=2212733 RepID=UPI0025CF9B41|nr:hypothetical protein [Thiofilum sp.]MBK8455632.1 hypothetical protein [Thiofilum sp.]